MNAWTRIGLPSVVFADRADAGNRLAPLVVGDVGRDGHRGIVVAGLVRGGLPVAAPIARALGAPLDVLCVGKIGVPSQRELAMGAVGEGDVVVSNAHVRQAAGIDDATFAAAAARVAEDVRAQLAQYRDVAPAVPLEGRTVVVVDDGVATGSTALAALRVVRAKGARRVLLAVPVAPSVELRELGEEADEVICLESPAAMAAVGQFYADFSQVTDDDVRRLLRSVSSSAQPADVHIEAGGALLDGILTVPRAARGLVVFAHGSGSSRHSPRNQAVAGRLNEARLGTLLFDLLTPGEADHRQNVFDVPLLGRRLAQAHAWLVKQPGLAGLPVGYFGASTGAAAALWAAAEPHSSVVAIVSRGGRPDLAGERLMQVSAPTLLVVGGADHGVIELNADAGQHLHCEHLVEIVPGATHLFEEPGALETVAEMAARWFVTHFVPAEPSAEL